MDRRAALKFLASLPFVGLLIRPQMADAAEPAKVPGLSWMTQGEPGSMATSLYFTVTREELERRWVEQSPNAMVPDPGLIRRFRSAMEIYDNCRKPNFQTVREGRDGIQPGRIHVEFQEEKGEPWGPPHDITLRAEDVFEKKRYAVIDRALAYQKRAYKNAMKVPADLDTLRRVHVRFLHA
jgi:hypothetical protein